MTRMNAGESQTQKGDKEVEKDEKKTLESPSPSSCHEDDPITRI